MCESNETNRVNWKRLISWCLVFVWLWVFLWLCGWHCFLFLSFVVSYERIISYAMKISGEGNQQKQKSWVCYLASISAAPWFTFYSHLVTLFNCYEVWTLFNCLFSACLSYKTLTIAISSCNTILIHPTFYWQCSLEDEVHESPEKGRATRHVSSGVCC